MPYIFYDTETSGLETAFDQILQFAAIKTDDDLNEVDNFNVRVRLLPHVVPSPRALVVNRVAPKLLTDQTLPTHYEAICEIRNKLLEWSPAIVIGYNSIGFDEELLRQAFFQTLHPAYLTNTEGNKRSDVLPMIYATCAYEPNTLSVPINEKGNPSFRLDQIAPANGYNFINAHEAMADVRATIYMARLIRERAPEVWASAHQTNSRNDVKNYIADQSAFALTQYYFGKPYSWLVSECGQNPENKAEFAVFDLFYDPDDYLSLSSEELLKIFNAKEKPIRRFRGNAQPIIMPENKAPPEVKALSISPEERSRRAAVVQGASDFKRRVGQALALRYAAREPSPYVEKRIYEGFPSSSDQILMREFHEVDWTKRTQLIDQIEDSRLKELAWRLVYFEHPELLPPDKVNDLRKWHAERVLIDGEAVPWTTLREATKELDTLMADKTQGEVKLFDGLKTYYSGFSEALQ